MKVLVTGGCGFVGRYFTKHFIDQGYEVDCVDKLVAGTGAIHPRDWPVFNIEHHPGLHFHAEDCRDFIKGRVPDEYAYVVHLAAIVGGRLVKVFGWHDNEIAYAARLCELVGRL